MIRSTSTSISPVRPRDLSRPRHRRDLHTCSSQQIFTLNASQLGAQPITQSPISDCTLTDLHCTGDTYSSTSARNATLYIYAAESVFCTFYNTKTRR